MTRRTKPYSWHFETGEEVEVVEPGQWFRGARGRVLDVLGAGKLAAVAIQLTTGLERRTIVVRAAWLRLVEELAE